LFRDVELLLLRRERRLAFDRASVRSVDADGRMHVAQTNISKSNVSEYLGKEIPDWEKYSLNPEQLYKLYRDPKELAAAVSTFNGLPVLSRHMPVTADSFPKDLIVGSLGHDAVYEHPYLKNSMSIWPSEAIKGIEDGTQREISSAYRYRYDPTPGVTPEGEHFSGVMRDIIGNHAAIIPTGRVGPDVCVGDSALEDHPDWLIIENAILRLQPSVTS
jgi:hypothetical protein